MAFPKLPAKAAYIHLNNPRKRNALSIAVLRDLRSQLHRHLTSPKTGNLLLLPPFRRETLDQLKIQNNKHSPFKWLTDSVAWREEREGLPNVLVLRSEGPVFSAGHDLSELQHASPAEAKETFALCAEVMTLIRRSPAPVVCPVQGLATAAGFQLAMTADYPIALGSTTFQLPGMRIGLPCTSPATAVSRRLPPGLAYRLFATGENISAHELGSGVLDVVPVPEHAESTDTAALAFEARVEAVVKRLAEETAGQPQAFGKWAYWAQLGFKNDGAEDGGDGYEVAAKWAGNVMAMHAQSEDAKEGMRAFTEKRTPEWKT
ncbi:enoyl coenzyme a hydratase domain containing 3 [Diaporthe amygdali]|uniref:enoyl coenzyme a hydratase domain containing 3 n=1 Tax=Phomopsis amygdali TaxID=1214568 RepID=UPI0022FED80B|nr:enoyl coenzyme a hydratase domain containing 3 [Diaporthe amygdali]KAJ0117365.1 enoyl coenzyme a hydratase domain containing 3 [Diaporthe amygdali]